MSGRDFVEKVKRLVKKQLVTLKIRKLKILK